MRVKFESDFCTIITADLRRSNCVYNRQLQSLFRTISLENIANMLLLTFDKSCDMYHFNQFLELKRDQLKITYNPIIIIIWNKLEYEWKRTDLM